MKKKNLYVRFKDEKGVKRCIRHSYIKTTEIECTFCSNEKAFIANFENHVKDGCARKIKNLATGSLKRHLATGKHWKLIPGLTIQIY